jgi:hypothetical protein
MLSCQIEICLLVMIKLNPRERCRHVTEAAVLIDLASVVRISMAVIAFCMAKPLVLPGKVAFVTVQYLMFARKRPGLFVVSLKGEGRFIVSIFHAVTAFALLIAELNVMCKTVAVRTLIKVLGLHFEVGFGLIVASFAFDCLMMA